MALDPDRQSADKPPELSPQQGELTRRECLAAAGALSGLAFGIQPVSGAPVHTATGSKNAVSIEITINGNRSRYTLDPRVTLLDLLREGLGLTGTKKGCDHGQCGACTVLLNGRRVNSCLALAAAHDGATVVTIEGLAEGEKLYPLQSAFIRNDGFQCGYCTPGQICSAVALIEEARRGDLSFVSTNLATIHPITLTDLEIRERMSGNICRCGAYPGIVESVAEAAGRGKKS